MLNILAPRICGRTGYLNFLVQGNIIDKNTYYDILTRLVIQRVAKDLSGAVDIGCHRGAILKMMRRSAPHGKFYAFEPLPHLFEHLTRRFGHFQNVYLYNIALSNQKGESDFNYVISNPGYSGFIRRRYDRPNEDDTQIKVRTDLMDNLLADVKIDLIKIDVEGAELQVLQGAKEIIKRNKPFIIFEHGLGGADRYGTGPDDIYALLHDECALEITLLDRFLNDQAPLTRDEFREQFVRGLNYYFLAYDSASG